MAARGIRNAGLAHRTGSFRARHLALVAVMERHDLRGRPVPGASRAGGPSEPAPGVGPRAHLAGLQTCGTGRAAGAQRVQPCALAVDAARGNAVRGSSPAILYSLLSSGTSGRHRRSAWRAWAERSHGRRPQGVGTDQESGRRRRTPGHPGRRGIRIGPAAGAPAPPRYRH